MTEEGLLLGLGNCIDYEVRWNSVVLEQMAREIGLQAADIDISTEIDTDSGLLGSVLACAAAGRGGEFAVTRPGIIEAFARNFDVTASLGGTNARAAAALTQVGLTSTLHLVTTNPRVRELIPAGCDFVSSNDRDSLFPHLIVQFPRGAQLRVGSRHIVVPRENRVIYVFDPDNARLRLADELPSLAPRAGILLVSGLYAMADETRLRRRLAELRPICASVGGVVIYEDAAFHQPRLSGLVQDELRGVIDIHGMNEDEFQGHVGRTIDLKDPDDVVAGLQELREVFDDRVIVVHTSRWAVALGGEAGLLRRALSQGIQFAVARFAFGDEATPDQLVRATHIEPDHDARAFAATVRAKLGGAVCLPIPRARVDSPTTVGLGDTFVGGFIAGWWRGRHGEARPRPLAAGRALG